MKKVVLLDVDGTLVDSNDAHAKAWMEALRESNITVAFADIRCGIGMGGDHLLPKVTGIEKDTALGRKLEQRRGEIFKTRYLSELRLFPQARELLQKIKEMGYQLVVATSASKEDAAAILSQVGINDLIDITTCSSDAEESKPEPDIVQAALRKSGMQADEAFMLGDTPYDIQASRAAGVEIIAFRSGGWNDQSLRQAIAIYDGPQDLLEQIAYSPLVCDERKKRLARDSEIDAKLKEMSFASSKVSQTAKVIDLGPIND